MKKEYVIVVIHGPHQAYYKCEHMNILFTETALTDATVTQNLEWLQARCDHLVQTFDELEFEIKTLN